MKNLFILTSSSGLHRTNNCQGLGDYIIVRALKRRASVSKRHLINNERRCLFYWVVTRGGVVRARLSLVLREYNLRYSELGKIGMLLGGKWVADFLGDKKSPN
jgi:hypothetical protein